MMPIYRVTYNGVLVHQYTHDVQLEFEQWPGATQDVIEPPATPAEPPAPPVERHITKLAFRNRFAQAEKVAIEIASLDDPAAPMQQRALAATLRANQQDLAVAQYIDLNRPDTRAGVQALEQYGLIGAGRAAAILDTEPSETEVWRG